jgi:hypothetical protein
MEEVRLNILAGTRRYVMIESRCACCQLGTSAAVAASWRWHVIAERAAHAWQTF